jgi:uncharacterized protein (TIGR03000 family)
MGKCSLSSRRMALALATMLWAGGSVWAQPQTTVTPRAPFASPAFTNPISPFLFGPPAYPFRATAPSSTMPAPTAAQISGISHAPSLGSIPTPPPRAPQMGLATHSQANLGAFVGFAPLSSLSLTETTSPLPGGNYRPAADNSAHISLRVPADAQVWFDGKATKQTGPVRSFNSPPLTPGKKFVYEVRVRWMKDGKPVEEKRRIKVEAKDWLRFDLTN